MSKKIISCQQLSISCQTWPLKTAKFDLFTLNLGWKQHFKLKYFEHQSAISWLAHLKYWYFSSAVNQMSNLALKTAKSYSKPTLNNVSLNILLINLASHDFKYKPIMDQPFSSFYQKILISCQSIPSWTAKFDHFALR